jgi:hypothetical protein
VNADPENRLFPAQAIVTLLKKRTDAETKDPQILTVRAHQFRAKELKGIFFGAFLKAGFSSPHNFRRELKLPGFTEDVQIQEGFGGQIFYGLITNSGLCGRENPVRD